jgi:hypothetical protein
MVREGEGAGSLPVNLTIGLGEEDRSNHVIDPVLAVEAAQIAPQQLSVTTYTGVPDTLASFRLLDLNVARQKGREVGLGTWQHVM